MICHVVVANKAAMHVWSSLRRGERTKETLETIDDDVSLVFFKRFGDKVTNHTREDVINRIGRILTRFAAEGSEPTSDNPNAHNVRGSQVISEAMAALLAVAETEAPGGIQQLAASRLVDAAGTAHYDRILNKVISRIEWNSERMANLATVATTMVALKKLAASTTTWRISCSQCGQMRIHRKSSYQTDDFIICDWCGNHAMTPLPPRALTDVDLSAMLAASPSGECARVGHDWQYDSGPTLISVSAGSVAGTRNSRRCLRCKKYEYEDTY